MKAQDLNSLSNEQLAEKFAELSLEEFKAERRGEIKKVIRLAKAGIAITRVLKARKPDGRRALLPLLDHENPQVRLSAAEAVAAVALDRAVETLKDLHQSAPSAQRGAAGVDLYLIEQGIATLD
jgi:hypothetical protein